MGRSDGGEGERTALERLTRAYGAVCACNSAIVRALSEEQLLDAVCHTLVEVGGYRIA